MTGTTLMNRAQGMGGIARISRCAHRCYYPCVLGLLVVIASWWFGGVPCLRAQQAQATASEVKAAYLYNFGRFVEWPNEDTRDKSQAFEICVLGADPFGPTLDATVGSEIIGGKTVMAKRIATPQDVDSCRIVFISSSEEGHLKEVLTALDKVSVLTVSDIPHFSQRGGMIGFILDGNRIRFDVNLASAENAGLMLSSELLKVAAAVRKNTRS